MRLIFLQTKLKVDTKYQKYYVTFKCNREIDKNNKAQFNPFIEYGNISIFFSSETFGD